jgi:hypothetical protein
MEREIGEQLRGKRVFDGIDKMDGIYYNAAMGF